MYLSSIVEVKTIPISSSDEIQESHAVTEKPRDGACYFFDV